MGLLQSMSRRGNCLDNAPIESFFGHFKDEVDYKQAESLAELHTIVMDYMNHYNHTRKQWTLKRWLRQLTEAISLRLNLKLHPFY